MPRSYPFVDWMKAIGLMLIVFGHLAHRSVVWMAPPIYLKQFGVTFFVFATGFTLVRETRPVWRVVYQRLFEVVLWGLGCALTLSAIGALTGGSLQPSNYLPFALGGQRDRKSTRLNSSHLGISYAVFCLKKKNK